jgi:NAD(P)-dependent dehydrogenase (short-subunit alcohol dehydrogenase family)
MAVHDGQGDEPHGKDRSHHRRQPRARVRGRSPARPRVLPEATAAPAEVIDAGLFRETFDTNLIGAVGVTEQLLPLLRQSQAGRIVNVSTTMGSLADQSDPESPYYSMIVPA